jgi:hypothetical protein
VEVYNHRAPEWWDFAEWDFSVQTEESGDEASLTEGEADLRFLLDGELEEESADDAFSWGEDISPTEDEAETDSEDKTSSDEYPPTKRFRAGSWDDSDDDDDDDEDEDEEEVPAERYRDGDEYLLGSDDEGDDGDDERAGSEDEDSSGSSSDSEEESSSDEDGSDGDDAGDGSDGEGSAVC